MTATASTTLRLFGFHHAGGGPTAFAGWQYALGGAVEVVPVALPAGAHPDFAALVERLADDLAPRLEEPYVCYGHSMGALVAYRLARLREARGQRLPDRLLLGAFAAPHLAHPISRARNLTDDELEAWLLSVSDVPAALLGGDGRRAAMLGKLREDLRLCATHREDPRSPLPVPIDVFAGTADPLVPLADARAWSSYSGVDARFHPIPGGHFFPRESKSVFFERLRTILGN
ncbi:MAG TPA: alpha/beta fold hydrolase [Amycolatopsis sp.]|uniref:Alpha/beta fold hydrolase n=1 Tax=Amycolatopsis nalaikhensis TaxID=715472 RepID=A0ABY8XWP1_9PSEU|nr:alpha/beta fold hydrolase [Amycolatopsis sp. 2-2]WIV59815.1 alpha/beta fold hydrolase [Amycolatopsis sp. 2-2]